jgi:hypothetical protein
MTDRQIDAMVTPERVGALKVGALAIPSTATLSGVAA